MNSLRRPTAVLALACAGGAALLACSMPPATSHAAPARAATTATDRATADKALRSIVRLAEERAATADTVAAAKWGTAQPIDVPAREKVVLDGMAAKAAKLGIDGPTVHRVFEDQIAANKVVQRALYAQWRAHPSQRATRRPDLTTEVRPVLDRVDGRLLTALKEAQPLLSRSGCTAAVDRDTAATVKVKGLDSIHRKGLDRALVHLCRAV
ncbi:chorismate mutase [Streptomyces vinaceus]|uniref:chorismate mutase n=1 Tax=Streptomyces vinaceus TaxID=1960 RepID=UPI0038251E27